MDKIKSFIKKLNIFFGISFWISIVVAAIVFITIFYTLFDTSIYNSTYFIDAINTLTLGRIEFVFSEGVFAFESNKLLMISSLFFSFGSILLTTYCIYLVRKVLQSVLDDTLFSETVVSNIQDLAYTLFVDGTVANIASYFDYQVLLKSVNLDTLFISDKITNVSTTFTFDYSFIGLFLIVYLFSLIFKYGVELQKLSDETL